MSSGQSRLAPLNAPSDWGDLASREAYQQMMLSPDPAYAGNGTSLLGLAGYYAMNTMGINAPAGSGAVADPEKQNISLQDAAYNTLPWLNPAAWGQWGLDQAKGTYDSYDRMMSGHPEPLDGLAVGGALMGIGGTARAAGLGERAAGVAESQAPLRTLEPMAYKKDHDRVLTPSKFEAFPTDELKMTNGIGHIYGRYDNEINAARIYGSKIDHEYKGRGHGIGLYKDLVDKMHSDGRSVISDKNVSLAAQRMYSALERRGYQVDKNPDASPDIFDSLVVPNGKGVFSVRPHGSTGPALFSNSDDAAGFGAGVANALNEKPQGVRAYRGAVHESNIARNDAPILWGSSSPDVASTYARPHFSGYDVQGSVAPLDLDFKNPLTLDAQGGSWANLSYAGKNYTADDLALLAKSRGHDGLAIQNVLDAKSKHPGDSEARPATTYAALKPNTVRSATTGETLFSNSDDAAGFGVGVANALNEKPQGRRVYHGTDRNTGNRLYARGAGYYKDGAQHPAVWLSNSPRIAGKFAENGASGKPNVIPADITSDKIKDVQSYFLPPNFSKIDQTLENAAAEGFHGVRFKNLADAPGFWNPFNASDVTAMIKPGHVKSATTGETLFSNSDEAAGFGSTVASALNEKPQGVQAYRGFDERVGRKLEPRGQFGEPILYASSSPDVAGTYAGVYNNPNHITTVGAVSPVEMNFTNPMVHDAKGRHWNDLGDKGNTTIDHIADRARRAGHDGLIVHNVIDDLDTGSGTNYPPATTYAALRPNTVKSATTGETLFSNSDEAGGFGAGVANALNEKPQGKAAEPPQANQTPNDDLRKLYLKAAEALRISQQQF